MKQVILIRHAATDLAGVLCGHIDPPVNQTGQQQMAALVRRLRHQNIDWLYTSDLRRALQTAEAISVSRGIPAHARQDLREISFGAWEGLRWASVHPHSAEYPAIGAPGGESWHDFTARVVAALHDITSSDSQQIAIVTHLGVIRTAFTELAAIDRRSELLRQISYCSAHSFQVDRHNWTLVKQRRGEACLVFKT